MVRTRKPTRSTTKSIPLSDDGAPPWLMVMRAITGLTETPGDADNPRILGMAKYIGWKFREQADYASAYTADSIAWCGLTSAFCLAVSDIRSPFGPTDTDKWLWALSFADDSEFGQVLDAPRLGCIVVMERDGGGHVTMFEGMDGSNYLCRGGNQSDQVNVQSYSPSGVVALIWPRAGGPVPPAARRTIERGDTGSDVAEVQRVLDIPPIDGDFGAVTEAGVESFQAACGLTDDGVVGPQTWAQLDALDASMKTGSSGLTGTQIDTIVGMAKNSAIARYNWPDRGMAPDGYIPGMALTFALALTWLRDNEWDGHSAAVEMAKAVTAASNSDKDALAWYADEFRLEGMDNSVSGAETLRHLFVMLIGLGMRESSGNHWEGRDMSADNVQSNTAEAGLFQTSWDFSGCSPEVPALLDLYWKDPNGFQPTFDEGLEPTSANLDSYGTGDGAKYQWLAKFCPAFAVMTTAVGLRKIRQHWGPINRKETELVPEADELLADVQELIEGTAPVPPDPQPEPPEPDEAVVEIDIRQDGPVTVIVNGKPL